MPRAGALALACAAALVVAACGKQATPKVEDPAAERAAATERAKHGPYGTQLKALDTAKALGADMNRKAEDEMKQVDK